MSAGDQRGKIQSSLVPGSEKDNSFDYNLHSGYTPMNDPYNNYYATTPYMFGVSQDTSSAGTWSNAADLSMPTYMNYGQMNNDSMYGNGIYGFDYSQFGWNFQGGDFSAAWGQSANTGRKDDGYPEYYGSVGGSGSVRDGTFMNGDFENRDMGLRGMDTAMRGMSIGDKCDRSPSDTLPPGATINSTASNPAPGAPKKMSWASVASQPARPQPQMKTKGPIPRAPVPSNRMDIGTWGSGIGTRPGMPSQPRGAWGSKGVRPAPPAPYSQPNAVAVGSAAAGQHANENNSNQGQSAVLESLKQQNQYNPKDFNLAPKGARFFIIKSYSEDDIHRSIKYNIWCSTEHGNKRLDSAFREREGKGNVFLFFSVNGSGHFCGMAQMASPVDYNVSADVWAQDKWKGRFDVKWIYVKDVPNSQLRHIRLENNENKPVTNSRDTQEVPPEKGKQVLKIMHHYRHTTSIFDDFGHYEKREEEEEPEPPPPPTTTKAAKNPLAPRSGSGGNGGEERIERRAGSGRGNAPATTTN